MNVPLLDLKLQYARIRDEVEPAVRAVMESQYFILGPEVQALEREIAEYCQCAEGIGVSSGTDALLVAMTALGIGPGDEVIAPSYTYFATAGCIDRLGARPVLVDVDPETFNFRLGAVEAAIGPKTKAILPVHLFGQIAEMVPLMELAAAADLPVIEDAAQAIGAELGGRRAGSFGLIGCFSFYPTKNLGGFGDGGMITTDDAELARAMRVLRNQGHDPKYVNKVVGGNFRLDALQAAILRIKLRYLDEWHRGRQVNAALYRRLFEATGLLSTTDELGALHDPRAIALPVEAPERRHIYNQFVVSVHREVREGLIEHLRERRIGTEIYYPIPCHLQECFDRLGYRPGDLPVSENAARQTLALPIFPELTEEQIGYVVEEIAGYLKARK